jgi:hypothetical protein
LESGGGKSGGDVPPEMLDFTRNFFYQESIQQKVVA